MNRNLTLSFAVFLLIVLGACLYLLSTAMRPEEEESRRPPTPDTTFEAEPLDFDAELVPMETIEPLAISGRVVDSRLRPVSGLELAFGGESAVSGASGEFSFPAVPRSGGAILALRRDEEEIGRFRVRVGPGPLADIGVPDDNERVASSWRLRWSLTIFDGPSLPPELPRGERRAANAGLRPDTHALDSSPALEEVISPRVALLEDWGGSGAFHVSGESGLPDDAAIFAALLFEGLRVVSSLSASSVLDGAFLVRFRFPEGFRPLSDRYDLEISFDPLYTGVDRLEAWRLEYPGIPWDDLRDAAITRAMLVGSPEEARADDEIVRGAICDALGRAVALRKLFNQQWNQVKKLSAGWDGPLLEARAASRSSWIRVDFASQDGAFDEPAWRHFVDDEWRPRVSQLIEEIDQTEELRKYREADDRMKSLLGAILAISRNMSNLLYVRFGLPLDRRDADWNEYEHAGDAQLNTMRIEDNIRVLEEYCAKLGMEAETDENASEPGFR